MQIVHSPAREKILDNPAANVERKGRRDAIIVGIIAIALAAYCIVRNRDSLLLFFWYDDLWLLHDAAQIDVGSIHGIAQIFVPGGLGFGLYRPLTTVGYYTLLRQLFDVDSSGYHAAQLLLHVVNVLLVFDIARRLSKSHSVGLAVALLYTLAPGHGVAIYWPAAVMTGNASSVLLLVWCWLWIRPPWRLPCCAVLQLVALFAGEYAVVAPVILAILAVFGEPPGVRRRLVRDLLVVSVLPATYVILKLWYLRTAGLPPGAKETYEMALDPAGWLLRLGHYAVACLNALTLLAPGDRATRLLGASVIGFAVTRRWCFLRGSRRWRLAAVGAWIFIAGLLPVLPLRNRTVEYEIGIAALGAGLAMVGVLAAVNHRRWEWSAIVLAALIVLVDLSTHGRATRENDLFKSLFHGAERTAAWVTRVELACLPGADVTEVYVPNTIETANVFAPTMLGETYRYFRTIPARVHLYEYGHPPDVGTRPRSVIIGNQAPAARPNARQPGWEPRFDWLRRAAGWVP